MAGKFTAFVHLSFDALVYSSHVPTPKVNYGLCPLCQEKPIVYQGAGYCGPRCHIAALRGLDTPLPAPSYHNERARPQRQAKKPKPVAPPPPPVDTSKRVPRPEPRVEVAPRVLKDYAKRTVTDQVTYAELMAELGDDE
jgi:hypothetical protein